MTMALIVHDRCVTFPQYLNTFFHCCRHTFQSGTWAKNDLAYYKGQGYTIRDAINFWYHNASDMEGGVVFRDQCSGPLCNDGCPEELILQEEEAIEWSTGLKTMLSVFVLGITIISMLLKVFTKATLYSCTLPALTVTFFILFIRYIAVCG